MPTESDAQDASASPLVVALVGGSHFVNHAYFMLLPPVFAQLRDAFGVGDPQLGLALGLLGFVVAALQLPFGHVSDAHSRTLVLGASLGIGAIGAALTATAQSYAWLLAAQVVLGVGIAGHHPAHYPLLSAATPPDRRGRAYSIHGFTGVLGFAAPPAVVGVATSFGLGWRTALGGIAALGAVYAVGCMVTFARHVDPTVTAPPTREHTGGVDRTRLERVAAALRDLLASPAVLVLTALWFVSSAASWGIRQYAGTLLSAGYGLPGPRANIVVSAMLAVGAVLIFGGGWLTDRVSSGPVLLGGYAALVVVAGVLAWGGLPALAVVPVALLASATVDGTRPARAALADRLSSRGSLGKNFGLLTIGISGGGAVAPPVLGVVVSELGVAAAFGVIAATGLLAVALTVAVLRVGHGSARPAGAGAEP